MWKISSSKLFSLLSEPSQVTNQEMQSAYEEFVSQLTNLSQSVTELAEAFRKLNLTRIEFGALRALPFYGQGKKCPEKNLPEKNTGLH